MMESLGNTLIEISGEVPDGMLVFFPSYAKLTAFVDRANESDIWHRLNKEKKVLVEPRNDK